MITFGYVYLLGNTAYKLSKLDFIQFIFQTHCFNKNYLSDNNKLVTLHNYTNEIFKFFKFYVIFQLCNIR